MRLPLPSTLAAQLSDEPSKIRKIQYKVLQGDSLGRIANRFRVRVGDITQWSEISPQRSLQPGHALKRFVDVRALKPSRERSVIGSRNADRLLSCCEKSGELQLLFSGDYLLSELIQQDFRGSIHVADDDPGYHHQRAAVRSGY